MVLVALTWLIFGQTLGHDFVNYDDQVYVYEEPQVNAGVTWRGMGWALTHTHAHNWHPLTSWSHMLDSSMFGLKPAGHHFTSVALHTVAVLMLFALLRQMTGAVWRSAAVAALFAIHPLRVESVAWVSERKDVLSGVFFLGTLLAYGWYVRKPSPLRYVAMAGLFALGLMSKPMLVTLPFVLLLLDLWPLQRREIFRRLLLEKVPLLLLSAGAGLATVFAQTGAIIAVEELPLAVRVQNAIWAYLSYLWQLFWPQNLAVFYPINYDRPLWHLIGAISLLALTTAGVVAFRKRRPYLFTGWFWFVGMLVPVIGLLQVGSQAHADRYTYLPHIGLLVSAVWGCAELCARWPSGRWVAGLGTSLLVPLLAWKAHAQTAVWQNSESLWNHALAVTDRNNVAHGGLANFLLSKRRLEEAADHFEKALAIRPHDPQAHNTVGLVWFRLGRPNAGFAHWRAALAVDPTDLNAQSNLAWIFATCPNEAVRDGQRAVAFAEDVIARSGQRTPVLLRTLAAAYAETGRFPEAIRTAEEALRIATEQNLSGLVTDLQANIADFRLELPVRDPSLAELTFERGND